MEAKEVFHRLFQLPCDFCRNRWSIDISQPGPQWSNEQIAAALAPLRIRIVRTGNAGYDWSTAIGLTGRIIELISVYRDSVRIAMKLDTPRDFSGNVLDTLGSVILIEDPIKAAEYATHESGWILAVLDEDAPVQS